jgi:ribonuclease G
VRQLRLRDIGGIIVIDFIDMANPKNRQAVEDAFRTELERDRTKTYVVEISPLGLVEMTRQNVTDGPREVMTRACPTCGGDGIVVSDATNALQIERRLRALAVAGAGSRVQAYRVALHPRTLALVAGPGGARLAALEDATRRRFYLVPAEGHSHADHFEVLAEGRRDDLAPAAPVAEGAEVEVKLVELDLHDVGAAVGKLDGVDVVVADTAKLVGKKVKAVVGRVLDGQAFATLAETVTVPAPITFESEAEKPTRAPARRKTGEAPPETAEAPAAEGLEPVEVVEEAEEAPVSTEEDEAAGEDGTAPATTARKRTRRGSRGGKRRKKPASTTADAEDANATTDDEPGEPVAEAAAEADDRAAPQKPKPSQRKKRAPKIHVPSTEATAAPDEVPAADTEPLAEPAEEATSEVAEPELASDGASTDGVAADGDAPAPKKRTRRGSRGGRNRKRKAPAANGDGAAAAEPAPGEPDVAEQVPVPEPVAPVPEAEPADAPEGGYVPMSEWIEDFDRR